MKVLFVCLGNICRSPLGEGILRHKTEQLGLDWEIDSAGTSAFHAGERPDRRSIDIAKERGINISRQRSRLFDSEDFEIYDHILVMDESNLQNVTNLTEDHLKQAKVRLILNYTHQGGAEVPDPYYDDNGFEIVFDLLDKACDAFIADNNR